MGVEIARPELLRTDLERWLPSLLDQPDAPVDSLTVDSLSRPSTGQSNETILFEASWEAAGVVHHASFVLRLQPRSNQMFLDADVVREGRLLARLGETSGLAVPRVHAVVEDSEILGVPFFLMSKVDGRVPAGSPSIHVDPWLREMTADQRRRLMDNALAVLPVVHGIDLAGVHDLFEVPEAKPALRADVARLRQWYEWARRDERFPLLDRAIATITAGLPDESEPVLLWGDPRPGNIVFAPDLTVAAVLDWEIASIGPTELDVGWWLMMDEFARRGAEGRELDGFPSESDTVHAYQTRSGRRLRDLDYFKLIAATKLAITLIPAGRSLTARSIVEADSRFAHDNVPTQIVARLLGEPEPDLSPDYRRLSRMSKVDR